MSELLSKLLEWLKKAPSWAKIATPLIVAVLVIVMLLASCGTTAVVRTRETSSATVTITSTPQTSTTVEVAPVVSVNPDSSKTVKWTLPVPRK